MLTFLVVGCAGAVAGTNAWTSAGLQGGTVYDLAFHPTTPSVMYASASNGFYRSTDSGATWQQAPTPTSYYLRPTVLAVTAGHPDDVYVSLLDGEAVRSADRGVSLVRANPLNVTQRVSSWATAAAPDGSVVYSGIDRGVYASTDRGATRQLRGTLPPSAGDFIVQLQIGSSDARVIYAVAFDGVHRSPDGGATWQLFFAPPGPDPDFVWRMAIDPRNPDRIWLAANSSVRVTADGGSSWSVALAETASDIDIDPLDPDVVYASLLDGRVMRTTDAGQTWLPLVVPQKTLMRPPKLAIVPGRSHQLYLFGSGIYSSLDAGDSWQRADAGIDATAPGAFSQRNAGTQPVYFPIAEYGIGFIPSDDVQVHVLLSPPLSAVAGVHPPNVTAVIAGGDQSRNLVAAIEGRSLAFSTNFGGSWSPASAGPPAELQIGALARAAAGSRTVYVVTSGGIYRSEDDGDHWIASNSGLPAGATVGPIVVTRDPMTVFAAVNDLPDSVYSIYKSSDGGLNWAPSVGSLHKHWINTLVADPVNAQILVVGSDDGAFSSSDGGASWTQWQLFPMQAGGLVTAIALDPLDRNIVYFGDRSEVGRVFRSVDGGKTFQNLMPDYYIGGTAVSLLIRDDQPDRIIAAMNGDGVREFTVAPDLRLTSGATTSVSPGRQGSFPFSVTNLGPFDATSIRFEAQLSGAASAISATIDDGACAVGEKLVTCTLAMLRKDATATINLLATPSATGTFRVDATVSARQPDVSSGNNTASSTVNVSDAAASDSAGGGGGGGGGALSVWLLSLLALLCAQRARLAQRRL